MAVLAQLAVLKSKKDPRSRLHMQTALTRKLYEKNWKKQDISNLHHLVDWLITLPDKLEIQYAQTVKSIEENREVKYITSIERISMQQGVQQGMRQGVQQGVQQGIQIGQLNVFVQLLECRFGKISENYREKITQTSEEDMQSLVGRALTADTLEDVFN